MAADTLTNQTPDIHDPVAEFLRYCDVEKGLAESTLEQYGSILTKFVTSSSRGELRRIGEAEIRRFLAQIPGPRTRYRAYSVLRQFFKFLIMDGLRRDDPLRQIDGPKFGRAIRVPLSQADAKRLVESATGDSPLALRDRAMLELLYATAIRVTELTTARLSDLDLNHGSLVVRGKGNKERLVPFGRPAANAIQAYLEKGRPKYAKFGGPRNTIFLATNGRTWSRHSVWHAMQRLCRAAGIRPVGPHTLRGSMGAHMIENHADLRVVQEIMGHSDIEATVLYTRVTIEHLRQQLLAHHPRSHAQARKQIKLFQPTDRT
jgi:integrase/recombinase XerD